MFKYQKSISPGSCKSATVLYSIDIKQCLLPVANSYNRSKNKRLFKAFQLVKMNKYKQI